MSGGIDPNLQREFHCNHCNGRIVIPAQLPPTTGPCPICGGIITSPPPFSVHPDSRGAAPAMPSANAASVPAIPSNAAPPTGPTVLPAPGNREPGPTPAQTYVQETPVQREPSPVAQPARPEAAQPASARHAEVSARLGEGTKPNRSSVLPAVIVLFVLILAVVGALVFLSKSDPAKEPGAGSNLEARTPVPSQSAEDEYLRVGWQRDAYRILDGYIAAKTIPEKTSYLLGGANLATRMMEVYGTGTIDDTDTPAAAFSAYDLSIEDRKRGLFMMIYEQPQQFEMREFFRPLATLEVQYGLEEADILLTSVAQATNFSMDPVKVHAFFKRTEEGLKLDWDIFVQTKYRTLLNFIEAPRPGAKEVFRVFINEDVPENGRALPGFRTYTISDPANLSDAVRINVQVDSEVGRALSPINWRGDDNAVNPYSKNATVELEWVGHDDPQLVISRFICWQFLGLGGDDAATTSSTH
jgi:hypothetical protein